MVTILEFEDPTSLLIEFINEFLPSEELDYEYTVTNKKPEESIWDESYGYHIAISEVGGIGKISQVYQDIKVNVDVTGADSIQASAIARRLHALISVWPQLSDAVDSTKTLKRPVYFPRNGENESIPSYTMTFELIFKGKEVTLKHERP